MMSGVAMTTSKSIQSAGDLLDDIFAPGEIGSGLLGFLDFVSEGQDADLFRLAGPVGKDDGAADHLVGMLGIDPEPHGHVDGLVELGVVGFLEQIDRFDRPNTPGFGP